MKSIIFYIVILFINKSFSQERDLFFYTEKAKTNSPLLIDLSNQIKLNSLDSLLNKSQYKPQLAASINANIAPNLNNYGYDNTITNSQSVAGLIGVNKRIIGKGQINSQAESFTLIKESLSLNKKITVKELNRIITSQYIMAIGSAAQIKSNKKMLTLLTDEAHVLKKLTQNAIYKQTDYLIFLSSLKQQELQVMQLKNQYQNDVGVLNYLCGIADTTFISLKIPDISIQNIQKIDKSLFFKQFENDSLRILNQNRIIDNRYKPSLSLLSDVGYLSSFYSEGHKNFGFSVGLSLSVPIYDGDQRSLSHQKNTIALATTAAYKNNFNRQYNQQLLQLYQKLEQINQIEKQLNSQLSVAEALIEADQKLLLTGDTQITEFVNAIANIISINNTISQNKVNKLLIVNEINYWSTNN